MSTKRMCGIAVMGVVLCVLASASRAADKSTPIFTLGIYVVDSADQDAMTATAAMPIEAVGGVGLPDDPEDIIVPWLIQGATVTFVGRSAENGCFYTTWGKRLGGGDSGGKAKPWEAWFNDNDDARVVLTVNEPGTGDDYVAYGDNGATLTVRVLGGSSTTDYAVTIKETPEGTPEGDIAFDDESVSEEGYDPEADSEVSVTVKGQGGKAVVQLNGGAVGKVKIAATSSTAMDSSEVVEVVVPTVQITAAGIVLTGNQTTVVGKHIKLVGKVIPAGAQVTAHKWTIGGTTVKGYTQTLTAGTVAGLAAGDLDDDHVEFYWIAGAPAASRVQVKYEATVGGIVYEATLDYAVTRPTATLTSVTTTVIPAVGVRRVTRLMFGDIVSEAGIKWPASVTTADQEAGEIALLQTNKATIRFTDVNGYTHVSWTGDKYLLDSVDATVHYSDIKAIGNNDTQELTKDDDPYSDTPYVGPTATDVKLSMDHAFVLYLMYKPAGDDSIWVTLRTLDWSCKGSSTKTDGTWAIDAGGPVPPVNPGSVDSSTLATWTGHAQSTPVVTTPYVAIIDPATGVNTGPVNIAAVRGAHFAEGATVKLTKNAQAEIVATIVTVVSDMKITCTFDLTGKAVGAWNVVVTNPDNPDSGQLDNGFTVQNPIPTVTGITPATGVNTGSVNITNLAGTNFRTGATVKLTKAGQADIMATGVSVGSETKITCTVDLTGKAVGTWNVVVTNTEQPTSGQLANGFTVQNPIPTVTGITPATGVNTGSVNITNLAGTNFRTGATVKLTKAGQADIVATIVSVDSETKITCTVDLTGKAAGAWSVVVTNVEQPTSVALPDGFEVTAP